jgi:glycolate oxidase FAD binding subunit
MGSIRRDGLPQDAIDEVVPRHVVSPTSITELRKAIAGAYSASESIVFVGNRTKIAWGLPPRDLDQVIETSSLPKFIDHTASDLVVRVSANVTVNELQEHLKGEHQRLALDTMVANTSIGGLIATGISGPLRYGFGAVRDLLIGISVVRSDGVVAVSGGRVVKNVAGYDLAKLYTGSYGTLGAITEAFFRLHALPEHATYLLCELTLENAHDGLARLIQTQTAPSAIEVFHHSRTDTITIGVLIEGPRASVESRTTTVASTLQFPCSTETTPPPWWGTLPGTATFKMTVEIASVAHVLNALHELFERYELEFMVTGSAGVGVLVVGVDFDASVPLQTIVVLAGCIRVLAQSAGGACVVLRAPALVRTNVDVWGPIPTLDLMQRIKEQFDPRYLLAPGRFVGGI